VTMADANGIDGHRVAASLRFELSGVSFRADPPPKQITASGSSRASIALGARSFACGHSRPCPCLLPRAIIATADSDAFFCELGHGRAVRLGENPAALALGKAVQGAPFLEGENGVIVFDKSLPKPPPLGSAVLEPLLALLLGFGLLAVGASRAVGARRLGFSEGHRVTL
jgi:hypothetical protein